MRTDGARNPAGARLRRVDVRGERLQIFGNETPFISGQIGEPCRRLVEPKAAKQLGVSLDMAVAADQQGPCGHHLEQPGIRLRGIEHLLRQTEPPRGHDRDDHGNPKPQQGQGSQGRKGSFAAAQDRLPPITAQHRHFRGRN